MVVDKDVEVLGEWTLGEVKTEWVPTLSTALQMEGSKSRVHLHDWPTSSAQGGL